MILYSLSSDPPQKEKDEKIQDAGKWERLGKDRDLYAYRRCCVPPGLMSLYPPP